MWIAEMIILNNGFLQDEGIPLKQRGYFSKYKTTKEGLAMEGLRESLKKSLKESAREKAGAKRFKNSNLRRLAGFSAFGLLLLAALPGCDFFKGGSGSGSSDSSGVTTPGAAGSGYSHHIFTSPSSCASAHGSLSIH